METGTQDKEQREQVQRGEIQQGKTLGQETARDTRHHAHHHARPRLLWGVAAVVVVAAGIMVWAKWGEEIHEACFGDGGACEVDLGDPSASAEFDTPEGF